MVSKVMTIAPQGFNGQLIEVESDTFNGLPSLQIVGLGNKSIDEARERVKSAITNSYLDYPKKKITINLAPAEIPKDGTHYDLPIALSILCSSNQIKQEELKDSIFAGELALDGAVRAVRGSLIIAETAKSLGFKSIYMAEVDCKQATIISGINLYPVSNLKQLYLHLKGEIKIEPLKKQSAISMDAGLDNIFIDDIKGQEQAKRALLIAASGRHNILLTGPPGTGKSMLAKSLVTLLPPLSEDEQIAVTKIYNLAGQSEGEIINQRPFRSPHHTASRASIIGGGKKANPGEVSLAHLGVLFLDELPEFPKNIIESLRQPLEDRKISVNRVEGNYVYPCDVMLVGTMNPCPCGYYGHKEKNCTCTPLQIHAYQRKISGPVLDRIDIVVNVSSIEHEMILNNSLYNNQHSDYVKIIKNAKKIQNNRYRSSFIYNSNLSNKNISSAVSLANEAKQLLNTAAKKFELSARAYIKTIKVARTIADLSQSNEILASHIAESLQYRMLNY